MGEISINEWHEDEEPYPSCRRRGKGKMDIPVLLGDFNST
jgi:hypothetical protein